jgi:hydroxyacylglutathione hydrolase
MSTLASNWLKRFVLLLVIMLAAVVAMNQCTPLDVIPASTPSVDFSAVRDYLIQVITGMGLQSEIQTATITPRPSDMMPEPGDMVDPTIVTRSFTEENMPSEIKTITLHYLTDVNCYLVKTGDSYILIDTGFSTKRTDFEKELESAGVRPGNLKLIVLTHGDFDHTGNAAYLRKKFGTEIAMHDGDSGMVERGDMFWNRKKSNIILGMIAPILLGFGKSERFKPDLYIEDGYNLSGYGFDAKVLHIPGHSKGSIGILTAGGDLFCGDLFMNEDEPGLNSNMDDSTAANASVEKLKSLKINTVYPGHGKPFPMDMLIKNNAFI